MQSSHSEHKDRFNPPRNSFLVRDALFPFLDTCETNLSQFLDSRRGRFTTTVSLETREHRKKVSPPVKAAGGIYKSQYPFEIAEEAGMATDLRISAVAEGEHVVFSQETVVLGNVQPGIFSVALDATVKAACEGFVGLLLAVNGARWVPPHPKIGGCRNSKSLRKRLLLTGML